MSQLSESVPMSAITANDRVPEPESKATPPCTPTPRPRRRRPKFPRAEGATPCSSPARDPASQLQKANAIVRALHSTPLDVVTLQQLAISRGGLLNDAIRREAWPKLLHVDTKNIPAKPEQDILHGHRDYNQVVLDVNRSLKRFPPGMDEDVRLSMQDQLVDVIMWVLVEHPELHYYQGYHDIVVTFLLVLGEDLTFGVMDKLSTRHLRDFMDQTMEKTNHMLNYLYPMVGRSSPELRDFMEKAEVGTMFALSWLITWYGHVLNDIRHIVRLYDFFIACDPLMPIYLSAALVLHREKDVLAAECEMAMVHCVLARIPDDLPYEFLITRAGDLFIQYPPKDLHGPAQEEFERKKLADKLRLEQAKAEAAAIRQRRERATRPRDTPMLIKVTVWTVTAVLSAAAFAMLHSRTDLRSWLWT